MKSIIFEWRGVFDNAEINALHAQAFETRVFDASEWNWVDQVQRYSLGWVVARADSDLAGFANVLWDGLVHAWLQDVMVAENARRRGVGVGLVRRAREGAADAGCEYLHVDFEDDFDRSTSTLAGSYQPTLGSSSFSRRAQNCRSVVAEESSALVLRMPA